MATTTLNAAPAAPQAAVRAHPAGSIRVDWVAALLALWAIGGLYLDGWAHAHGRVDDVFFTPWHGVLYGGVMAQLAFLALQFRRGRLLGHTWNYSLPPGYFLSAVGGILFIIGGGLDLLWHTLFGIEVNLETLLSPTHLLLATAGILLVTGPVRAAVARYPAGQALRWANAGPALITVTLAWSVLTFFTQFAHPISSPQAVIPLETVGQAFYSDLYVVNADGSGQTRLTASADTNAWGAAWSPDGSQVAFSRSAADSYETESAIYVMKSDGTDIRQVADLSGLDWLPAWSPDGARLAFLGASDEGSQIYVAAVDGGHPQVLAGTQGTLYLPQWSPDGASLLYSSAATGTDQLYVTNIEDGSTRQVATTGPNSWGAVWSPDGAQIAFNASVDDNTDIYLIGADGSELTRLTDAPAVDFMPAWSPDGRQIAFVSDREGMRNIYVMDADGGEVHNLTDNHAFILDFPRWATDGRRILYSASPPVAEAPWDAEGPGLSAILLQSALLMGVVLMMVLRWRLPFGALTLMFTVNALAMTVFNDLHYLALPALAAGLVADGLLLWLKPLAERARQLLAFAFLVPAVYYGFYFLTLQLTDGIAWTIHLWLGAIFIAGAAGLLVSLLGLLPIGPARTPGVT